MSGQILKYVTLEAGALLDKAVCARPEVKGKLTSAWQHKYHMEIWQIVNIAPQWNLSRILRMMLSDGIPETASVIWPSHGCES